MQSKRKPTMTSFSIESILASKPTCPRLKPVRIQPYPFLIIPNECTGNTELTHSLFPAMTRKKRKRYRTIFSEAQIEILENLYKTTQYPDLFQRESVALHAGLQEERVEVWFKNRRARARKVKRAQQESAEKKNNEKSADEKEEVKDGETKVEENNEKNILAGCQCGQNKRAV